MNFQTFHVKLFFSNPAWFESKIIWGFFSRKSSIISAFMNIAMQEQRSCSRVMGRGPFISKGHDFYFCRIFLFLKKPAEHNFIPDWPTNVPKKQQCWFDCNCWKLSVDWDSNIGPMELYNRRSLGSSALGNVKANKFLAGTLAMCCNPSRGAASFGWI